MHHHYCWGFVDRVAKRNHDVDRTVAVLQHYKRCHFKPDKCQQMMNDSRSDDTTLKFRTELIRSVSKKLSSLSITQWWPALMLLIFWLELAVERVYPRFKTPESTAWSVYDWLQNYSTDKSTRRNFSGGGGASDFRRRLRRSNREKIPVVIPPNFRPCGFLDKWTEVFPVDKILHRPMPLHWLSLRCFWSNLVTLIDLQLPAFIIFLHQECETNLSFPHLQDFLNILQA